MGLFMGVEAACEDIKPTVDFIESRIDPLKISPDFLKPVLHELLEVRMARIHLRLKLAQSFHQTAMSLQHRLHVRADLLQEHLRTMLLARFTTYILLLHHPPVPPAGPIVHCQAVRHFSSSKRSAEFGVRSAECGMGSS